MKKIIYSLILSSVFTLCATMLFAQGKPAKLPMENKAAFENYLRDVYTAYEKMDYKALKNNYYGRMAGEINPDGAMVQGIKALEPAWKAFDAMLDERPTFKYQLTSSRMITPEVAIITWNSEDDIMIKGQQVGGKIIGMAVLKKKNNSWTIEFDTITRVVPPPPPPPAPPMEKKEEMQENPQGGN
jgi:hypothetical protein